MTERTVKKQSLRMEDEDSISITSTQESEADEERSYVVDRILAEQDDDEGHKYYLVRWDGYALLASTWEPAENIEGQATLDEWAEEKMRIARELSKEFDVAAFEDELERIRSAKEDRRERRKAKRERLGLATFISESDEEFATSIVNKEDIERKFEADISQEEVAEPVRRGRRKLASKPNTTISQNGSDTDSETPKNITTARVNRRTINLPTQDPIIDTSEDSFVEEARQETAKATARTTATATTREKRFRAATNRRARDALSFVSDEESSLSRSASPAGPHQKLTQSKPKVEAPSRTGYQGTAHRRLATIAAASLDYGAPVTLGATRGRPRGRGRGTGRGHERVSSEYFSFTAPHNQVGKSKQKKSLANAILKAPTVDAGKPVEHFKTPSMVRKAELAARSLADRAPDMQSVGPLSRPSDYGGGRPIRKKTQLLNHDSSMGQDNKSSAASTAGVKKTQPSTNMDEEKLLLTKGDSWNQIDIRERTAKMDLHQTDYFDRITAEAGRISPKFPQGVPTGPRALVQKQANNLAEDPGIPNFNVVGNALHEDVNISPLAKLQAEINSPGNAPRRPSKAKTKINLKEYRARRKSEFLGDAVPVRAIFGNQGAASVLIGFTDIDRTLKPIWLPILSGIEVLNFNRTCIAQEFSTQSAFLQGNVHATGSIIADAEEAVTLEEIAEWLRPCSGLVFLHDVFCILIFPAKSEEWKFLDSGSDSDHKLRYQIYEPMAPKGAASQLDNASAEITMPSLDLKRHYLDKAVELMQNLQYHALLTPHPEGQDVHNFYLFFPRKALSSAKYIVTWLRACNRDCRIYTNRKLGSWNMFTNNPIVKAGTIIIHAHLLPSIFKIPRLARLINSNITLNFWCMDDGSCVNPLRLNFGSDDAIPSLDASMIRLFPHGGAVFLTPSFLITQPERTCDFLKWFQKKLSSSTLGTWRLVLPNECRQYLLDLATEMASLREKLYNDSLPEQSRDEVDRVAASQYMSHQECEARFQSYFILDQLLKNEFMSGVPGYWEEDSPDDAESPIIYADGQVEQNDEKALVTWFAGWTMLHLHLYRKFVVIGTTSLKRRPNTTTAKSIGLSTELEKVPIRAAVLKFSMPQETDTPANATKSWNRSAFSPSSMPAPLPKANGPLDAQNQRRLSQSGDSTIDIRCLGLGSRPTSWGQYDKARNSEPVPRDIRRGSRTRHGIDENQPPAILEFIAITGTEAETAKGYLTRYNGDVHTAVQKYWYSAGQTSSPRRIPQMDGTDDSEDPAGVVGFIANTHASAQIAERYLHLAQDDVRRAINLYNESQQHSRSPSSGLPNHDGIDVREDAHEGIPSGRVGDTATLAIPINRRRQPEYLQEDERRVSYDQDQMMEETQIHREGQSDMTRNLENNNDTDSSATITEQLRTLEQPISEGDVFLTYDGVHEDVSLQPRKSGIISNEVGTHHFVPRSIRPSGTTRPEISIRPGYTPLEDRTVYKNSSVVGGIPHYEVDYLGSSSGGSRTSSTVQSPASIEMGRRKMSFPDPGTPLSAIANRFQLDPNFESTVEWYGKLSKNGQGWEHIYVGGWEACFPRLMNVRK